jgi:hypothetical protein
MPAIAWPNTLPNPQRDGHAYTRQDGRVISDMDQGAPRMRQRFANTPRKFDLDFVMTSTQLAAFEALWDGSMQGGVLPVAMPIRDATGVHAVDCLILSRGAAQLTEGGDFKLSMSAVSV